MNNPVNPIKYKKSLQRIDHGGSWINRPEFVRASYRNFSISTYWYVDLGFRIMRNVS